jgi:predicted Rossmann-fold nucleotide-binding protein
MSRFLPSSVFLQGLQSYSQAKSQSKFDKSYDLCTEDGKVTSIYRQDRQRAKVIVEITNIDARFVGFIAPKNTTLEFTLKSSLTQLGINAETCALELDPVVRVAKVHADLVALNPLATLSLDFIKVGAFIGKLFANCKQRRVITLEYVNRLKSSHDFMGVPLLVYGATPEDPDWDIEVRDGRVIAWLPVQPGIFTYSGEIHGLLPTVGAALIQKTNFKELLRLHQEFREDHTRVAVPQSVLMVRSYAMRLRTMFGRVVDELLPKGLSCMSSRIIEPDSSTKDPKDESQGRTFVFHGHSTVELTRIPIEFFALEAYREHVLFSLRKSLPLRCTRVQDVLKAFNTMPKGQFQACTYICKGSMFDEISGKDWVTADPVKIPYVGNEDPEKQQQLAEHYLFQQSAYGILSAIAVGDIASDGVLLTRYFPSPVLKSLLLSRQVCKHLRAIFFLKASREYGSFFSQEDNAMLGDLHTFGISVFHVDESSGEMFQFMRRVGRDSGMMVPMDRRHEYLKATFFGVYGSNLVAGDFEAELNFLLNGILQLQKKSVHPLLQQPLALITGGGPGAMEVGNRVAKALGILSCGMFVDFGSLAKKPGATINEQRKNPYVEAFMTYRPEKLVERQSDFNLDFPIFLTGGIGTDFEFALEEVRRKVGATAIHPLVLFGSPEHWGNKITHRFQENLHSGTIKGSEWMSTVPWVVADGREALQVYTHFFSGTLPIGPEHPANTRGFMIARDVFQ